MEITIIAWNIDFLSFVLLNRTPYPFYAQSESCECVQPQSWNWNYTFWKQQLYNLVWINAFVYFSFQISTFSNDIQTLNDLWMYFSRICVWNFNNNFFQITLIKNIVWNCLVLDNIIKFNVLLYIILVYFPSHIDTIFNFLSIIYINTSQWPLWNLFTICFFYFYVF